MTGTQVLVVCTVITTVVAVLVFLRGVLRAAKDREAKDQQLREARDQTFFNNGVASRVPFEDRLRDQRDDARRARDLAENRVTQLEARVTQLEDDRRGRT